MDWTEREIAIAKGLTEKETQDFLTKVFVTIHTENGEEFKKNIVALDDAEYGRLMKVLYLTRIENKSKINLIARIAKMEKKDVTGSAIAPK